MISDLETVRQSLDFARSELCLHRRKQGDARKWLVEKEAEAALAVLDRLISECEWKRVERDGLLTADHSAISKNVLVRTAEGNHYDAWFEKARDCWYAKDDGTCGEMPVWNVTHWRSLPAAPMSNE